MKSFYKNNKFIFSKDEYKKFNKELKEIMKQISNYKHLEHEKEINNLLNIEEEKEFLLEYILFTNYEKWINTNIDLDIYNKDNNQFFEYFKKYKIYDKSVSNEKLIRVLFHMYLFLMLKIVNGIQTLVINNEDQLIIENNIKIINHSYHILFQIFILVAKLYNEDEFYFEYIFLFFDALAFFIEKEDDIINDKYVKIKNKILYELLFDFYGKISLILFKGFKSEKDMLFFINYLKQYLGNNILNSNFGITILTTYNIFQKFMLIFLNNFNYSSLLHKDIYQLYKNDMIDIFANIYGRIINHSNFFEILINQNKDSFVNLYNFTKNKELIINDIYLLNFYIELLSKIYEKEKNKIYNGKVLICPPTNSFIFNGYNSKMTIKLNNFQLDNSFLFFSFHINDNINNTKCNLPLLIFENELNNDVLFKIYIKKIINPESHETQMKLTIYQENKKKKIKKDIILDKIDDIKFDTNYFIGLYLNGKKLCINIRSVNIIRNKYHQEVEINNIINKRCILKIGHNGNEKEYFKGYIGSIIIIKQLSLRKDVNYEDIIYNILKLKEYYKFFPYFICKKTKYNFNNIVSFYPNEYEYLFSNIRKFLQKNIIEFDCFLYLTPEIIDVYHSLMDKYLTFNYLPCVPDICELQRIDDILDMNISLTNFDSVYIDFLRNNGINYICLIYEYFYQFSNLYMLNKDNFKLGSPEENIKRIIIISISKTLIILKNYNICKFVNQFENSFKKTYKNLSECLKSLNEIWNIITEDIISNLYELVFTFLDNIIVNKEEKNLIVEDNNKIMSFSDGLIDILFDVELYKKYKDNKSIDLLFLFVSSFLIKFIKNTENKLVPSKYEFFWKIINFTEVIDKFFTDDYKNKNKIISSFFHLLDNFLMSIKDDKSSSNYFKKLLHFSLANFQNNLVITYNFLCFIHGMIWKGYTLEEEDIILLLNFSNKYYVEDKDIDNKLIDNIFSIVSCILINLIMNKESTVIVDEAYKKLITFSDNQVILPYITNEIRQIIEILIQNKSPGIYLNQDEIKYYKNNIKDNMKFYWNIFSFIISLFKNLIIEHIINNDDDNKTDNKEKNIIYNLKYNVYFSHIYTLLINIEEILRFNNINSIDYIHSIYCLVNFIKFYHYVIFNEKNIFRFLEIEFIDNLLQVINLCSKFYHIINCGRLFNVKIDENYYNKTIIEIIFDLYIQYFLNDINSIDCYNNLLKFTFYENDIIKDKKCTIFYANDYFRYLFYNKKNIEKENSTFLHKYNIIFNYNDKIFKNEELFNNNFTTFFLLKIGGYILFLNNIKNFKGAPIQELKKNINKLFLDILEEHRNLYELSKDFFFKQINSTKAYYIDLIKTIKKNIKKKKNPIPIEEIKKIFDNNINEISEKIYKNFTSGFLNTNKKENEKEKKKFFLKKKSLKSNSKDYAISPKRNDSKDIMNPPETEKDNITYIKIEPIKFPSNINIITYFNDLDISFLKNPKKEIMNNIFSIYYIDIFYHNDAFCKMRDYFINNYLDSSYSKYIKQLDFPSKIKNYSNNLECPFFIKQYNDYFNSPIFPITHSYINDNNKSIINNYKAIKLLQKKFPTLKQGKINKYECELIKNENYYYGNIFQSDSSNYLLFQEEDINIKEYETGYKYLFLLSWFYENEKKKNKKKNEKYIVKKNKKNILIIFDEIEEIVERRILLIWKAVEIFLKNGKSYIFNFLNSSQFENFMKIFNDKSTKNLIRKKDFFNEEKNIVSEWKNRLINNYEYILLLNRYSSRSFNDVNQYPVFPWLLLKCIHLKDFNDKENLYEEALKEQLRQNIEKDQFYQNKNSKNSLNSNNTKNNLENEKLLKEIKDYVRSFKFPPSLQNKDKREISIIKYEEDEKNGEFPKHSSCHYSTSAYIYFYLMRQQPFCDLLVKLQGYCLENTNRCFINLSTVEYILENSNDNRELIPEFFSKIEFFLNLNCEHYGYLSKDNIIMDDALTYVFDENQKNKSNKYPLSNYVHFILEHKKFLNSKIIGYQLNKWIDNIFGINQLSDNEKIRKSSCNIFEQYSYEQIINLEKKLKEEIDKNINEEQIKNDLSFIMNFILNFGQAPYQIFNESHCELNLLSSKNEKTNNSEKDEQKIIESDEEEDEDFDLESIINNSVRNETLNIPIDGVPLYFQINPIINKIFVYNNKGNIIVLDCEIFNKKDYFFYYLSNYSTIEKSNIFYYGEINQYLIYKLKYAFSSFDNELLINNKLKPYHTYYTDMMNNIKGKTNIINKIRNTIKTKQSNKENKLFIFMTCRHIDYSFKIHILRKSSKNKITKEEKYFSFICEDFVCSCCTVSDNQFILGLKNGKLIYYYLNIIINENIDKNNKTKNKNENDILSNITIKLEKKRYIKGHKGKINVIEIDKRIGVVITSGDDNYIFIRKLYDFELLLPIKIKSKYIVLMCKISSFNFLYILCYNKIKNKTVIFGYTLTGLKFAKSEYGLYDNISFTGKGNIVTMDDKKNIITLSGYNLSRLKMNDDNEKIEIIKKINNSNWTQFDCFMRKFDDDISKIMTYFSFDGKNNNIIQTLNVNNIKYFD